MDISPKRSIGLLAKSLAFAFKNQVEEFIKPLGISAMDGFTLMMIYKSEEISLAEIARKIDHAHPSMLRHVDALESKGLLRRIPHEKDRRIKLLKLTAEGEKIVPEIMRIIRDTHKKAYEGFTQEETDTAVSLMQRLLFNLTGSEDVGVPIHCHHNENLPSQQGEKG